MPALVCSGDLRFALPFRFFVARIMRDAVSSFHMPDSDNVSLQVFVCLLMCLFVYVCVCMYV